MDVKTSDSLWKLYVASFYFVSYTITSVGFGDIAPVNFVERLVGTLVIFISGISFFFVALVAVENMLIDHLTDGLGDGIDSLETVAVLAWAIRCVGWVYVCFTKGRASAEALANFERFASQKEGGSGERRLEASQGYARLLDA